MVASDHIHDYEELRMDFHEGLNKKTQLKKWGMSDRLALYSGTIIVLKIKIVSQIFLSVESNQIMNVMRWLIGLSNFIHWGNWQKFCYKLTNAKVNCKLFYMCDLNLGWILHPFKNTTCDWPFASLMKTFSWSSVDVLGVIISSFW